MVTETLLMRRKTPNKQTTFDTLEEKPFENIVEKMLENSILFFYLKFDPDVAFLYFHREKLCTTTRKTKYFSCSIMQELCVIRMERSSIKPF